MYRLLTYLYSVFIYLMVNGGTSHFVNGLGNVTDPGWLLMEKYTYMIFSYFLISNQLNVSSRVRVNCD